MKPSPRGLVGPLSTIVPSRPPVGLWPEPFQPWTTLCDARIYGTGSPMDGCPTIRSAAYRRPTGQAKLATRARWRCRPSRSSTGWACESSYSTTRASPSGNWSGIECIPAERRPAFGSDHLALRLARGRDHGRRTDDSVFDSCSRPVLQTRSHHTSTTIIWWPQRDSHALGEHNTFQLTVPIVGRTRAV